jgi:hypothetical protein
MNIKEEVINVEVTLDELGRLTMPHLANIGFEVTEVDEAEIKIQISDTGEIKPVNGVIIKFKRAKK